MSKINGSYELNSIYIKDSLTNIEKEIICQGLCVSIGQVSDNEPFKDICYLDEFGYIMDNDFQSKIEGIFVAGDCRHKDIRQVVTANSDGAIAAIKAISYLDKKTSI